MNTTTAHQDTAAPAGVPLFDGETISDDDFLACVPRVDALSFTSGPLAAAQWFSVQTANAAMGN